MSNATVPSPEAEALSDAKPGRRLMSLDALRGFDMFWIIGADAIVHALRQVSDAGPVRFLANQMDHRAWQGFAFYDLIAGHCDLSAGRFRGRIVKEPHPG